MLVADCDYVYEDEQEQQAIAAAEEHLKTKHPDEAVERERVRALLQTGRHIA
jgi:hypothetical protein